ncbi:ubiquitin carboxyl-terminal hydrolase 37-like isoform X2 [Dreissena polymorpha]|uniref:ubiquitin carboxyl-terminal hydrolase 37-like isoform X2 n=1 Tax=Dreissena polymorpha TaxID=45954 RepID=UPI0022650F42|nr:ubiquitin carboxyl-terminal hydrolase 37-like isoform X2 [Dreissena polymorpha]
MPTSLSETLPGQVRISSLNCASGKFKTGALYLECNEHGHHQMKVIYNCGPARTFTVTAANLIKKCIKEQMCYIELDGKDYTTISFKPDVACRQKCNSKLTAFCDNVLKSASKANFNSKAEVGVTMVPDTGPKSGLFASFGSNNTLNSPKTSPSFTSVKSVKKEDKENLNLNVPYQQFYGKSSMVTSTPVLRKTEASFKSGKRVSGMMDDPTPTKRPRLLSETISYSMKPKPAPTVDAKPSQQLQGFSNLGNTCYMNAILQSLYSLDTFTSDLHSNRRILKSLQSHSLYLALVRLMYVRRNQTASDLAKKEYLRRLKSAISSTAKRFSGYGQHDAHEFLCQVLDQLKEEIIKLSKATPTPCKEVTVGDHGASGADTVGDQNLPMFSGNNPITVNFEFEVLHTLTCMECGEQVSKEEQFHDISLDVPRQKAPLTPRSLQDAISLFFRNEQIEYTCEKCGHKKSDVTHRITRLPRVFILHLKRYSYSQIIAKNTKMGQSVSIPRFLTFNHHCTEKTMPPFLPELPPIGSSTSIAPVNTTKEDSASRRKLDYSGYRFKSNVADSSKSVKEEASDKKDKGDEVDGRIGRSWALTLEDEEDPEIAQAIEMSLREEESREKLSEDLGEENSLERALEMSRRDISNDSAKVESNNLNEMTFEEQMELAMRQSLMESHHYGNYALSDDVTENGAHDSKSGSHGYTSLDDVISDRENKTSKNLFRVNSVKGKNRFAENDDVTKNGDHEYTKCDDSGEETLCRLSNSKSSSYDIGPEAVKYSALRSIHINKEGLKSAEHSMSESEISLLNTDDSQDEDTTSKATPEYSSPVADLGSADAASNTSQSLEEDRTMEKSKMDKKVYTPGKKWGDHVMKLTREICVDNGQFSTDENDDASVTDEANKDKKIRKKRITKKTQEICAENDQFSNDKNEKMGEEADLMCREKLEDTDGESDNERAVERDKGKAAERRQVKGGGREVTIKEEVMEDDNDDDWLAAVDDKENIVPNTAADVAMVTSKSDLLTPRLSDPMAEFDDDPTEGAGVDVEGINNLPEINNEIGDLPYSYRLVSIVNHMGISTSTGHYISDVYDLKKKSWFSCDDSHVTKVTEVDVQTKRERSGYIFFYLNKDIFDDLSLQHTLEMTAKQ